MNQKMMPVRTMTVLVLSLAMLASLFMFSGCAASAHEAAGLQGGFSPRTGAKISGAVLPDPEAFFKVKAETEDWTLLNYGISTKFETSYKYLSAVQEYAKCIADHYSFTFADKATDSLAFLPNTTAYTECSFYGYNGSGNLGTISLYWYDSKYSGKYPVGVYLGVYPEDDKIVFTVYKDSGVSFSDDGYRCSEQITVLNSDNPDPNPNPRPSAQPTSGPTICARCHGKGYVTCGRCNGTGQLKEYVSGSGIGGLGKGHWENKPCPSCSGGHKTCYTCGGDGRMD